MQEKKIGPAGFEPATKGLCLPTTAFAASFEFVVWTIPSLYVSAVWSLHLPPKAAWLGISNLLWFYSTKTNEAFPEFDRFYKQPRQHQFLGNTSKIACNPLEVTIAMQFYRSALGFLRLSPLL